MSSLKRLFLLALVSAYVSGSETPSQRGTTTRGGQRSPPLCRKSQVEASPPESGYGPWTHAPLCVRTGTNDNELCVFTDANFHSGQGLSIIARPEVAEKIISGRLLQTPRKSTGSQGDVKYEAVRRPGRGIGLFVRASEKFTAGEVIMVDYPTMVVPSGPVDSLNLDTLSDLRWRALLQVPDEARFRTRHLAQSKGKFVDEIVNIFETNAFTHEKAGGMHDIIFPEAARVNHHCLPNAITRTNHSTFAIEAVALRDIQEGEEILISYLDPSAESSSGTRQAALSSGWGFSCQCSICRGNGVAESDARRKKMTQTKELIRSSAGQALPILEHAKTLLSLFDAEGMIMPKADNYELAAYAARHAGRANEARKYAHMAKVHWDIMFGPGSRESEAMDKFVRELNLR